MGWWCPHRLWINNKPLHATMLRDGVLGFLSLLRRTAAYVLDRRPTPA